MKKLLTIVLILLAFATVSVAADWAAGSGVKTGSTVISTKPGVLRQVIVTSASTNAITIDLYDNASTTAGNKMIPSWVIPAQSTVGGIQTLTVENERYGTGLYLAITTDGSANCVVIYREDN